MMWSCTEKASDSRRDKTWQNYHLKPRSRLRTKHSGSDLIPWFNSWQHKQENLATNHTLQVIMKIMTWSWSHLSLPELSHIPCPGQIPDSKGGTYICHADQSSWTRSLAARFLAFRPQRPQVWKKISAWVAWDAAIHRHDMSSAHEIYMRLHEMVVYILFIHSNLSHFRQAANAAILNLQTMEGWIKSPGDHHLNNDWGNAEICRSMQATVF